MRKITLSLSLIAFLIASLQAQRQCGAMEHLRMLEQQDPSILQLRDEIEQFTQNYIKNENGQPGSRAVVTIPVVVHVVYNTTAENVTDAQIQSQLTILNNDFRRLNADWSGTPSAFQGSVADCEVQFCLAQRDPNGNATTGIVRKSTSITSFSTNDGVKYSSSGGDNAWPSSSYLNIWVCDLSNGLLGYAQFPGGPSATDGVVIEYTAFGNTGSASYPFNLGRTATHEVGHWLNLYHIWGDDGSSCSGSDAVGDTPNQADENYGCPAFPAVSCSNGPNGDMFMNYMDYTDDRCMFMFTTGQKARMQSLFASGGARYSLLSSLGCQAPDPTACGTPVNLSASSITQTSATVSWGAVSGAVSYNLQYKVSSASAWTTVSTSVTSYGLSGLTAATAYSYQVQAVCTSASSSYSLPASFTTSSTMGSCTNNYESNNSRSTATAIAVNTNVTSMIGSSTDNDYFRFSNTNTQRNIRVTLSNLPLDYDLRLYKSNGALLATSQNGGTTSETIKYNGAPTGTYYIRVYGYNGAYSTSSCYTLNASISSSAFRTEEDVVDNSKTTEESSYVVYPNPSSGNVNLEMNFEEPMENVTVRVYDLLGNVLRKYDFNEVEGILNANIEMNDVANGVYHIVISTPVGNESRKVIISR